MNNIIRTRLAPSPSGCPHLGNLLIGVYNFLFKLKNRASLILRLEDTDTSRSCVTNKHKVYNAFNSIGIRFDESPVQINKFGPYIQTQRRHIYCYYNKLLAANGLAFWCRCKWKRVNALKRVNLALGDASVYDGKCLCLKLNARMRCKLRLKTPRFGVFKSGLHTIQWRYTEMQPLWVRGGATFHLANVVDDYLMRISHVLRGRDWVSSLSKHILLYIYLGFKSPKFYHLPLLSCSKGTKLSKRISSCGVDACLSLGIMPYTILIYLASLITGVELYCFKDAVMRFNLCASNKTCVQVNKTRLLALNKRVMLGVRLSPSLFELVLGRIRAQRALALCSDKSTSLVEIYKQMSFMFCFNEFMPNSNASRCFVLLSALASCYKQIKTWNKLSIIRAHNSLCVKLNTSLRTLLILAYLAVFNTRDSISLYDSFLLLDKEVIVFRLELTLNRL